MKQNLIVRPGSVGLKAAALSLILAAQAAAAFAAGGSKAAPKEISTATGTFLTRGNEAVFDVAAPELPAAPFAISEAEMEDLRDALAGTLCQNAPKEVDRLESRILDLKARYWALRIKKGIDMDDVRHNLAATIIDPSLKKEFYDRVRKWFADRNIPELNASEVNQFVEADQKAFTLHQECGL